MKTKLLKTHLLSALKFEKWPIIIGIWVKWHLKNVKKKYKFIRKLNPNLPMQTHDFERVLNFQKNYKSHVKFLFIFNWARVFFQKNYKSQLKILFVFNWPSGERVFLKDFYNIYKRRFFFLTKKPSESRFLRSIWWAKCTEQVELLSIQK